MYVKSFMLIFESHCDLLAVLLTIIFDKYEGRSINKLENSVILLIFQV